LSSHRIAVAFRRCNHIAKSLRGTIQMLSRFGHSLASCDDYRPLLGLELTDNLAAVAVAVDMGQLQVLYLKSIPTGGDRP